MLTTESGSFWIKTAVDCQSAGGDEWISAQCPHTHFNPYVGLKFWTVNKILPILCIFVSCNTWHNFVEPWGSRKRSLTFILLTWRIWWALNNASKWQMGLISAFKGLRNTRDFVWLPFFVLRSTCMLLSEHSHSMSVCLSGASQTRWCLFYYC
jgi:hypothetical protein